MNAPTIEAALADIHQRLLDLGRRFALVGGLAVSFRAEVRFTRDVDLAVVVKDDADFESLVFALRSAGYLPVAAVEHTQQKRLATARLQSPLGFVVDLIAASCGIEQEVVERATLVDLPGPSSTAATNRARSLSRSNSLGESSTVRQASRCLRAGGAR